MYHDQVGLLPKMQGWFSAKPHDYLIRCRKGFRQNPTPFHVKVLGRSGIQGTYLNPTEAIYNEFTANTNLNRVKLKTFPTKIRTKQGYPFPPYLLSTVPEVLARKVKQMKEIKGLQIGRSQSSFICR